MQVKALLLALAIANLGESACVQWTSGIGILLGRKPIGNSCDPPRAVAVPAPIACPASCMTTVTAQATTTTVTAPPVTITAPPVTVTEPAVTVQIPTTVMTPGIVPSVLAEAREGCADEGLTRPLFSEDGLWQCCAPFLDANGNEIKKPDGGTYC